MNDFSTNALKAAGASGIGIVILYTLAKDIITKSSPLPYELTFLLLAGVLFFIFILALKMLNKPKISRDSSVSIGKEASNSGTINIGDSNITKKEDNRNSSVSVDGINTGNVVTGDNNTVS